MPNPWILLGAMVSVVLIALGAYLEGEHQQANADSVKAQALQLAQDRVVSDAQATAVRETKGLLGAAEVRASRLQDALDQSRKSYDTLRIRNSLANLPKCPVPVADIGVLLAPAADTSGKAATDTAGPGPGSQATGTVDAVDIIANAEINRGAFERNAARLESCISAYDAARAAVNGQ